ncbi:LysR family transcriptional regulator [Pseudomonas sp. 5P_5.1_Bac1]|uniref:LysR family transcriptional regulator n=1 Tax=Pseudomonas sp. 5P_5.1_Bac1 TaxID=2971616 RepID=UPI0021C75675|nr:LysR family transcriptional regulator [Pseudomonas sp. 5P_5.1_Bac1]MCU1720468.1 LysR family transcriptional regulator [Pseudomonas sp. 5P_5.1_Bac1]
MEHKSLREAFSGLPVFFAVAREGSFTKAAARLRVTQTAVSHAVRALEARLGVQLLARNSRTVTPTEAGEQLLRRVAPHMEAIDNELEALNAFRDSPAGTLRISASDHAINAVLMDRLRQFLPHYPQIKVELVADNGFVDIVAERFDAGVRMGESLDQDMIAVRIGPDAPFAVVASPGYLAQHGRPQTPADLLQHNCINVRLPSLGNLWAWEFEKDGTPLNLRVDGQLVCNSSFDCVEAAVAGLGICYMPAEMTRLHLQAGALVQLLHDWSPTWPGLHLYYPSRRQPSAAMTLLIAALRYPAA